MQSQTSITNICICLIAGYVGTKVMEWESEEACRQEDAVRPRAPYEIAARKITDLFVKLADKQIQTVGGFGMSWGPVYILLRQRTPRSPIAAGLGMGAALSLIVDEGLTPLLGFSAPNRAYPLVTHLRGVLAHLGYGLGVAATAETLAWLGRHVAESSG